MKTFLKGLVAGLLLVPALVFAHGASRLQVEESIIINATPETVWSTVSEFGKIHEWHPAVASTEVNGGNEVGATRTLTLGNGATIENKLNRVDADKKSFQYDITGMSTVGEVDIHGEAFDVPVLPVSRYKGWVTVSPEGDGSKVTFLGKFFRAYTGNHHPTDEVNDAAARSAVSATYRAGLEGLKEAIEK